jgi:hypothetical protein
MDLAILQKFFFWCLVINSAVYAITALATLVMKDFLYGVHKRMFNMDTAAVDAATQKYLSNFKLLITVFNFGPWVAILVIRAGAQ